MSPTVLKFLSSLFYSASGAFQNFWRTRENLCMNRVRSLLSLRCLLQGYISEPRPNSRDLRTKGSVKEVRGFINIQILSFRHLKGSTHFEPPTLLLIKEQKRRLCTQLEVFHSQKNRQKIQISFFVK